MKTIFAAFIGVVLLFTLFECQMKKVNSVEEKCPKVECPKTECPEYIIEKCDKAGPVIIDTPTKGWHADYYWIIRGAIKDDSVLLKNIPIDIGDVCKSFSALTDNQKRMVYSSLFRAMALYESAYSPFSRYKEALGKDAVTGKQNTSEGLLQMSYQDSRYHGCAFDWSKDKALLETDPNKTIFNPVNNLRCGVIVLEKQVKKYNRIFPIKAYYWSVLTKYKSKVISTFHKEKPSFCN